eukprot:351204-Chlamydomonas_euryale.AAC.9
MFRSIVGQALDVCPFVRSTGPFGRAHASACLVRGRLFDWRRRWQPACRSPPSVLSGRQTGCCRSSSESSPRRPMIGPDHCPCMCLCKCSCMTVKCCTATQLACVATTPQSSVAAVALGRDAPRTLRLKRAPPHRGARWHSRRLPRWSRTRPLTAARALRPDVSAPPAARLEKVFSDCLGLGRLRAAMRHACGAAPTAPPRTGAPPRPSIACYCAQRAAHSFQAWPSDAPSISSRLGCSSSCGGNGGSGASGSGASAAAGARRHDAAGAWTGRTVGNPWTLTETKGLQSCRKWRQTGGALLLPQLLLLLLRTIIPSRPCIHLGA